MAFVFSIIGCVRNTGRACGIAGALITGVTGMLVLVFVGVVSGLFAC